MINFIDANIFQGTIVAVKKLNIAPKKYPKLDLTRSILMEFKRIKDLQHDHITRYDLYPQRRTVALG